MEIVLNRKVPPTKKTGILYGLEAVFKPRPQVRSHTGSAGEADVTVLLQPEDGTIDKGVVTSRILNVLEGYDQKSCTVQYREVDGVLPTAGFLERGPDN